jgi:hypothetical protein
VLSHLLCLLLLLHVRVAVQKVDLVLQHCHSIRIRVRGCRLLERVLICRGCVASGFQLS